MSSELVKTEMTADEMIFAQRMLPHFLAGKSPKECAEAVIADDARIITAFFDRSHSQFFPTADERGLSVSTRLGKGDVIAREISRTVYSRLRAARRARDGGKADG